MSCLLIGVEYGGPKLWVDRGNVTEGFSSIAHHGHAKVGFGRSATQGKKKGKPKIWTARARAVRAYLTHSEFVARRIGKILLGMRLGEETGRSGGKPGRTACLGRIQRSAPGAR